MPQPISDYHKQLLAQIHSMRPLDILPVSRVDKRAALKFRRCTFNRWNAKGYLEMEKVYKSFIYKNACYIVRVE